MKFSEIPASVKELREKDFGICMSRFLDPEGKNRYFS